MKSESAEGTGRVLFLNPVPCTGCLCCMDACALHRSGTSDPSAAAIRVELDPFGGNHLHLWCRQCDDAPCAGACPRDAIRRDDATEAWLLHAEDCIRCGSCVEACPFDAVFESPGGPVKCDLCGGSPACAEACRFQALRFLPRDHPEAGLHDMPESEQDPEPGRGTFESRA